MIEIKSVLDSNQLESSIENIRSIKQLERENGKIGGIVFAYKSKYKEDAIEKLTQKIRKKNLELEPIEFVDLWCILDSGIISIVNEEGATQLTENLEERRMFSCFDFGVPILLWFFIQLMELLDGQTIAKPDYYKYMGQNALSMVRMLKPYWVLDDEETNEQ